MSINKEQLYYIYRAIKEALKSPLRCKHGCVIVKNKNIVASGYNKYRGYNKYGTSHINHRMSIHAEEDAINSCRKRDLKDAELYVIRFNIITNDISNSKPCHNCEKLIRFCIKKYGLKCVYYSANIKISFNQQSDSIS